MQSSIQHRSFMLKDIKENILYYQQWVLSPILHVTSHNSKHWVSRSTWWNEAKKMKSKIHDSTQESPQILQTQRKHRNSNSQSIQWPRNKIELKRIIGSLEWWQSSIWRMPIQLANDIHSIKGNICWDIHG